MTDTLPDSVALLSVSSSQGSGSPGPMTSCSLGSLANGADATVTLVVEPHTEGVISNTTDVDAVQSDPIPGNNTVTDDTTITADLGCTITGTPGNDFLLGTFGNDTICGLGGDAGTDTCLADPEDVVTSC